MEVDKDSFSDDGYDHTKWLNYSEQTVRRSSDFISKSHSYV
jgi:hypothetical protein